MSEENKNPIDPKMVGVVISLFVVMLAGLYILFELFGNDPISPVQTLTTNCEAANGVMIQGLTQHGDTYENFAICVPYEALTCIDVE